MNRLGNLWRSAAGRLETPLLGQLVQTCAGTQVVHLLQMPMTRAWHACHRNGTSLNTCVPQRDLVRLRLQRFGLRNNPFYRIVAADSRWPRDGKHIEMLGNAASRAPHWHGMSGVWCAQL